MIVFSGNFLQSYQETELGYIIQIVHELLENCIPELIWIAVHKICIRFPWWGNRNSSSTNKGLDSYDTIQASAYPHLLHLATSGQNTGKRKCPILQYVLMFTHCHFLPSLLYRNENSFDMSHRMAYINTHGPILCSCTVKHVCHWDCTSINISFHYKFRMHTPLFYHSKMWSCLWQQVMHCDMESKTRYQCRSVRILLLICRTNLYMIQCR